MSIAKLCNYYVYLGLDKLAAPAYPVTAKGLVTHAVRAVEPVMSLAHASAAPGSTVAGARVLAGLALGGVVDWFGLHQFHSLGISSGVICR
jgi:hypothetical protein